MSGALLPSILSLNFLTFPEREREGNVQDSGWGTERMEKGKGWIQREREVNPPQMIHLFNSRFHKAWRKGVSHNRITSSGTQVLERRIHLFSVSSDSPSYQPPPSFFLPHLPFVPRRPGLSKIGSQVCVCVFLNRTEGTYNCFITAVRDVKIIIQIAQSRTPPGC